MLILLLLLQVYAGRIRPYGSRSLSMSNVNPSGWAEYNFTMLLETALPSNGQLVITFPTANYPYLLGLGTTIEAFAPYPKAVTVTVDTANGRDLVIPLGSWPTEKPLTITIRGIINSPKQGGTGNFVVWTRINGNIVDINKNFAVIGLAQETVQLLSASMSLTNSYAGEITNYVASMQPSEDLQANVDFVITLPDLYDLSYFKYCSCALFSPVCTVHKNFKNVITVSGNKLPIKKGVTISITLIDIVNPGWKMKTPLFNFRVIERATNNTYQESTAVPGLVINPGRISMVKLIPIYYVPYTGYLREFKLQFRPKNAFQYARVVTDFYQVMYCTITRGLLDLSQYQESVCAPLGRMMFLSNFQPYKESDFTYEYVEITFMARIADAALITNPVEIYTYKDKDYLYLADQDTESINSQISIIAMPTHIVTPSLIASSTSTAGAAVTLQVTLNIGAPDRGKSLIKMEIPDKYTGIPTCTYKQIGSATLYSIACDLKLGYLQVQVDQILLTGCPASCPVLNVANLFNPSVGGAYSIRTLVYGDMDPTQLREFNITVNVPVPTFTSSTVSQVTNQEGQQTAINFNLNIIDATPAGVKTLADPFVSFSTLEILFYQINLGNTIFAKDLGSGLNDLSNMGCPFQDVSAAQGSTLACVLLHGDTVPLTSSYATVKVFGYAAITPPGTLSFKVPVTYPMTNAPSNVIPKVVVNLIRYDQKIRSVMRSSSYNLGSVKVILGNPLIVFSGPVLESPKLQGETSLTYQFKTVYSVGVGQLNGLYYQVPAGFTFNMSKILVSIDGTYLNTVKSVQNFKTFLMILFELNFSSGLLHTLTIEKVETPPSLPSATVTHYIKTTLNGQFADAATFTIPALTKGVLFDVTLAIDSDLQNHPYVNYSIGFTTSMKSYAGSYIVVDFPAAYSLTSSIPYLDNLPYCNLQNSTTADVAYTFTAQQFRINNMAPLIKGQRITLGIYSVRNPGSGSYSLSIKILDSGGNIIEDGSKSITIGTGSFAVQKFDVKSVDSMPNNAGVLATYVFKMKTTFSIPKLAIFYIQFPASFTSLYTLGPTLVNCRMVQNANVGLRACYVDEPNRQVIVQTDRPLLAGDTTLEYYGYMSQLVNASGITINIQYNNVLIASANTLPQVLITAALVQAPVTLQYFPRNEGEIAYYIFQLPLVNFDIKVGQLIFIRFPEEYDKILGIEKLFVSSKALKGALKISQIPQHILISGFYEQLKFTGTLDITVLGIINPNRLNNVETGKLAFGILSGYQLLVGNYSISGIIPQLAPEGISLQSITTTTNIARYPSTFTFDFTPLQNVIATDSGGQVYVDFPNDFIIDAFIGGCETTQAFSFFASCNWDEFRFMFVTNNQQWDVNTPLQLTVSSVRTPDNSGETNNFIVYNYDSINKIVLGRTYSNLHVASINYDYDGLQIDVNNKQPITLEVGSYSDEIRLNITVASEFTITLSPNVLDVNILITPNPVQIEAGQIEAKFRIAAPRTILLQSFYIQWSKTGDTLPVTYAPLRLTQVDMVKGTLKRKLIVETMEYMPTNGSSYPLYIRTVNPPYQQLLIRLSFHPDMRRQKLYITDAKLAELGMTYIQIIETSMDVDGITLANLSSTQLEMSKLQYYTSYHVNTSVDYPDPQLKLYLAIKGYDADSYDLDINIHIIPIRDQEYRKPKILDNKILQITRSTATFQIVGDIKGFIYYVYADQHMPDPTFNGTQFPVKNTTLSYSNPQYGIDYIRTMNIDVNFTITGLLPNHDYEIFVFIMNLNRVSNPTFSKIYFHTIKSQRYALLTLKVWQSVIDSEVKLDYLQKMAEMITLNKNRLIERKTSCQQTKLDVSPTSSYIYWNLLLLPDPTNMNENTKPLTLAQTLSNRRKEIQKFITRLDDEPFFTLEELSDNIPNFVVSPEMIDRTISSIAVRLKMSYCGMVYFTIRQRPNSTSSSLVNETIFAAEMPSVQFPSAYQIRYGLNETNQPINSTNLVVINTDSYYSINYTELNSKTVYDVYISMENDFLSNKELFSNNSVAKFSAKTMKVIVPLNIYSINSSNIITILIILLMLGIQ